MKKATNQPPKKSRTNMTTTVSYRVRCHSTKSEWAWDVASVQFFGSSNSSKQDERPIYPLRAIESGNAGHSAWGAHNAIRIHNNNSNNNNNNPHSYWGGRRNGGDFWIGGEFPTDTEVTRVQIQEMNHRAKDPMEIQFEVKRQGEWTRVWTTPAIRNHPSSSQQQRKQSNVDETSKDVVTSAIIWQPEKPAPNDSDLVTRPSRPLMGQVHSACYTSQLQPPRTTFVPDDAFYHSQNCEGLWVCVSKECGVETLEKACRLVRRTIPLSQRNLWGHFRSPRWARDPGPMRLIVLDNRTNQQAGSIPELCRYDDAAQMKGRNQTMCPFVFTSREDFHGGVAFGGWCSGRLTLHEMTHGADMVIRQLVDPYFHDAVGKLWAQHCHKFRYQNQSSSLRTITISSETYDIQEEEEEEEEATNHCYAAANRDEFLAECHCIAQGLHLNSKDYEQCQLSTPTELQNTMPDVYQLLQDYFILSCL